MLNTYKTILSKKTQLNPATYLYHFSLIEPKEIIFIPGQYVILKVPSENGTVSRLYSIESSNTEKNGFQLIVEIIPGGLASSYFYSLQENTEVVFQGPAGIFTLRDNDKQKIFTVTGTGIAPIISILRSQLPTTNYKLQPYIFWGLKNYQDVYLLNELKKLGIHLKICLSREQNLDMIPEEDRKYFSLGHVDQCMEKQLTDYGLRITNYEFYLCGGRNVVEALKQTLLSKNIPMENIVFEKF
jgi:benzoate/toluate 1,2-dioxygenase reductase subunit